MCEGEKDLGPSMCERGMIRIVKRRRVCQTKLKSPRRTQHVQGERENCQFYCISVSEVIDDLHTGQKPYFLSPFQGLIGPNTYYLFQLVSYQLMQITKLGKKIDGYALVVTERTKDNGRAKLTSRSGGPQKDQGRPDSKPWPRLQHTLNEHRHYLEDRRLVFVLCSVYMMYMLE